MRAYILNETSIKVNWTTSSQANGYVIVFISSFYGRRNVSSTTLSEIVINELLVGTYNISVYSYKDLPSIYSTQIMVTLNGMFI